MNTFLLTPTAKPSTTDECDQTSVIVDNDVLARLDNDGSGVIKSEELGNLKERFGDAGTEFVANVLTEALKNRDPNALNVAICTAGEAAGAMGWIDGLVVKSSH